MFLNKLVALSIAVDTISIVFIKSKKVEEHTTDIHVQTRCDNHIDDSYYDDEDDWDDYVEMMNNIFGYNFLY